MLVTLFVVFLAVLSCSTEVSAKQLRQETTNTTAPTVNLTRSLWPTNAIYGLDFLGWGFDASYRDTFFALKPQLFTFTWTDPQAYKYPTGTETWLVPDQVYARTVGKTTTYAYVFDGLDQRRQVIDLRLNLKASTKQIEGELTFTLGAFSSSQNKKHMSRNMAETSLYQLYLAKRELREDFLEDASELAATYDLDPTSYELFLRRYGTHYVDSVVIGGSVLQETTFQTDNVTDQLLITASLAGKFESATGTKIEGSLNFKFDDVEQKIQTETVSSSEIIGGDAEFTDFVLSAGDPATAKQLFESWKATLIINPVTIRYRLVEIWQLFDDKIQQKEVCKALATMLGFLPDQDPDYCKETGRLRSGTIRGGLEPLL